MKILFFRSTWGLEALPTLEAQLRAIKAGGFDGVEMAVPHTHEPIADLWDINVFMRDWLKEQLPIS